VNSSIPPLPDWPPGTVVVLVTRGDGPYAIPFSAAVRAGPAVILIALAASRGSLSRLRADPRVAVIVLAAGDLAFTARGRATVEDDDLVDGVVAVRVEVEQVDDHNRPTFVIEGGVPWRWTDEAAAARDADVRAALARLAERI
jgi:flavin reductase (DIM6/NTAB) family NADH-FMN oxidoreductase RutF